MKKLISKISETPENIKLIIAKAIVHVLTIIGIVYYWNTLDIFWFWVMICGMFIISAIGGEAYLHRYCTHNSFELSKPLKTIIHFFSMFNLQGKSTSWAVGHTQHHVYPDQEKDLFQPKREFWKTWFWLNFHKTFNQEFSTMLEIKNNNDDMKFFNKNYWKIYFATIIISTLIDPRLTIFFFFVPVIITLHATGFTNVISHLNTFVGYRNFDTPDNSRNFYIPFLVGNTYHNNHHNDPNNYNIAVKWYEFDHIAWMINLLLLIDKLFKK